MVRRSQILRPVLDRSLRFMAAASANRMREGARDRSGLRAITRPGQHEAKRRHIKLLILSAVGAIASQAC
jgi:hypothetical protein